MNDQDMTILREALENTEEAFVTIDENHTVVLFNRAAEMIFGTARAEILGRDLNSIVTPECSANHRHALDAYLQSKTPRGIRHRIRDEGRLSIRSSVTDRAEIRVSDNGPGIPKEIRANIFSPFFTTKGKGSGLGLAISKRIIDAHPGWKIEFSSEDGRGTEFKISMPLARPADPAPGRA